MSFPNIFSMVCLNANAKVETSKQNLEFTYSLQNKLQTGLICNFKYAGWIKYTGAIDEIVIYFKPLGINAFLEKKIKDYKPSYYVRFCPFDDYETSMAEMFLLDGDERRLGALENYWSSKHTGFEHPFLHQVVDEILSDNGSSSINETARQAGISRQTLNKHFELHLGTTPSQFKKVVRFRDAMQRHWQKMAAENLIDISSGANYFDQSHMIKDFKTFTTFSPKTFFSKISTLEEGRINWLFL